VVDDYLKGIPTDRRSRLEDMRRVIRAAAPDAVETIAYDMPAFRTTDGRFLVSYAAYARHDSLFPASGLVRDTLGEEVAPFLSGKGTIRFPAGKPIPLDLVRRVIEIRLGELGGRAPDGRT
jgi:uncharacterized protein YdhG (YjbR/CyaY superfamily)